jgi:hypothetical protein
VNYPPPGGPPYQPPPDGMPGQFGGPPPQEPPWPHQQPWSPGPPPKKRGNGWKWAVGAVSLLAVVGVTAAVTISVVRDDDGGDPTSSQGDTFGLASAEDRGPANIITEDPSCAPWRPINETFVEIQDKGWNKRNPAIPATAWTPEQRAQYEEVGRAARNAADQTVPLAKLTPHRVMREIYEQFIAYARAYSDAIANYMLADDHLARVVTSSSAVIVYVCTAISYGSAQARSPLVSTPAPPTEIAPLEDPSDPPPFLTAADPTCTEWDRLLNQFPLDTKAWQAIDPAVAASAWNAEQRAVNDAVIPVMKRYADIFEQLGRKSANPVIQDLAVFAAQYRRAYADALPTYIPADSYLDSAAGRSTSIIYEACQAVGG